MDPDPNFFFCPDPDLHLLRSSRNSKGYVGNFFICILKTKNHYLRKKGKKIAGYSLPVAYYLVKVDIFFT